MKIILSIFISLILLSSCSTTVDRKLQVLDSLKKLYADKPIHLTFTNNQARTEPLTTQYAYVDQQKTDLAFKLESWQDYKLSYEEGLIFVPTTDNPTEKFNEMVLIETKNGTKRGYVSYKFIKEFDEVSHYDR